MSVTGTYSPWAEPEHFECGLASYGAYRDLIAEMPPLEHAVYSPRGRWGVGLAIDDYALLGGCRAFADGVRAGYDFRTAWRGFVADYATPHHALIRSLALAGFGAPLG